MDILVWHPVRRRLLVIELKTDLADVNELVGTIDKKRRLAIKIAADRGWDVVSADVSIWLIVADSKTNRRRVQAHRAMLRAAFPYDGRSIATWLKDPPTRIAALSFWTEFTSTERWSNPGADSARVRRISAAELSVEGVPTRCKSTAGMPASWPYVPPVCVWPARPVTASA